MLQNIFATFDGRSGGLSLPFASLLLLILCSAVTVVVRRRTTKNQLPLPPRPKGLPLVGNIFQFIAAAAKGELHLLLEGWARQYGDIFRVKLGPITIYFMNSDVCVKELFDRNSASTAERPRWIVSNEQICNRLNVLLLNGSDSRWKHQRKVIYSALTSVPMADAGLPFLHHETARFLREVANDPFAGTAQQRLWPSIGRYTYSTFAKQTYGMEIADASDPVIDYIFETGEAQIEGTLPLRHIVDVIPALGMLPSFLKPWERKARARFARDMTWAVERLRRVKADIASGNFHPAFLPVVVHDEKSLGFSTQEEAAYLALQLIIGAADTSRMSTWSFMEAMMMFPDVQQKARAEIEAMVGDRLPVYTDIDRIPYVRCLMKEVWRWRPPVALGHPHTTTRDITYGGYLIPKGARLQINAWAIGHDPDRHPDPDRFWPERFENDHTTTMQSINAADPKQRDHFAFGAGRRVCPGYHVAERSLSVAIMRILWAFDIAPAPGTPLPLLPETYRGFMPANPGVTMPVTLKVRSEEKRRVIEETYQQESQVHKQMMSLGDI